MNNNKLHRNLRIVDADISDEVLWKEFWADKTPEEKLNITEEIIRGKDAQPRLQRIYRVVERTSS